MSFTITKNATDPQQVEQLIDQIDFLSGLPPPLKRHFPLVIDDSIIRKPGYAEYTMLRRRSMSKSLRDLIFDGTFGEAEALSALKNVLDFTLLELFPMRRQQTASNITAKVHFDRFESRLPKTLRRAAELFPLISDRLERDYLRFFVKLLKARTLYVNGKRLENAKHCLSILRKSPEVRRRLEPKSTGTIHGDLHFDNILVNFENPSEFMLIDPRGFRFPVDITYDLGKIWHSLNGLYDFIRGGYYKLDRVVFDGVGVDYSIQTVPPPTQGSLEGGGSRSGVHTVGWPFSRNVSKVYELIRQKMPGMLAKYRLIKADPNWLFRTEFAECVHFITMPIFHVDKDIKRSIVLYTRGVELMNGLMTRYGLPP